MANRCVDWRCGVLDLLEAAALRSAPVDVRQGERWQRLTVRDVTSAEGEDWLVTADGERIAVSEIAAVRAVDEP
ncbi:hypothetical protein LV476_03860 [Guyparkeria hydrothermalis]|uniref:hypothetical protein n=1 Tax=Guyparkeria hydrothermalis TaxID=923 RepID=UPI0020207747|nr:hypothetical protein [Guyparkeria hydrothermalis]MCL7744088.1 hypothetical protein [Guyparkeria hydrothermalis]